MKGWNQTKQYHVLLIEDNPGDIRLTQEAFAEARVPARLSVVMDGEEALLFLERDGRFAGETLPDLILLDINLPRWDGKELLRKIKSHPEFKMIPVLILTTSHAEQDIIDSYQFHANSYLVKPLDFDKYLELIEKISDFWFHATALPTLEN